MGSGFSKTVSLGRRVFAREEFRFKLPPLAAGLLSPPFLSPYSPSLNSWTQTQNGHGTSWKNIHLKQISRLGGRPLGCEPRLQCASGQPFSSAHQGPALPTHRAMSSGRSQRSQSLGLSVMEMVTTILI